MSDDDNKRGPRGPRTPGRGKPGGGGFGSGPKSGFKSGPRSGGPKRPFSDKPRGDRPYGERKFAERPDGDRPPRRDFGDRPPRKDFGDRPPRRDFGDRPPRKDFGDRPRFDRDGGGASRPFSRPRPEGGERSFKPRFDRQDGDRPPRRDFGDRPPRKDFGDRPPRKDFGDRPPRRDFGDRPPRKDFGDRPRFDRDGGGASRPFSRPRPEGGERSFKPRFDRQDGDRPPKRDFGDRPPRKDFGDRPPRRDFGDGERPQSRRPPPRPFLPREGNPERLHNPEKEGGVERIAKVIARAGIASRRDAEEMIEQGRVTVDGETITSPALDVAPDARITIDGERLPARERTRLFLYHKPAGLVTTARDPEGRTTVFESLPEDLPRVVTIGRLDINTEGLLLLTNDGGLARVLGHPETAWLRRYRVRAHGHVTQAQLDGVRDGVTIDGESFGPVVATMDREQGDNTWLTVDLREGKNREVKRVLEHLGLIVNRLIRVSFGPFQLGELAEGQVEEVRTKVLRDQLGDQLAAIAGADFEAPIRGDNRLPPPREEAGPRGRFGDRDQGRDDGGRDFADRPRPRFGDRDGAPRRFEDRGPTRGFQKRGPGGDDKPTRPRRDAKYRGAPDDEAERPRDVLLRAEAGKDAVWRDEDTAGMRNGPRKPPRRGADPRAERTSQAENSDRERIRSAPIQDPAGRRVTVERVTGPAPEIKRKPRYTREDFAPRPPRDGGERPPFRPRFERDSESRPPRPRFERDGDGPRGPRKFGGGGFGPARDGERRGPPRDDQERRGPPRDYQERRGPPRGDDERRGPPRGDDERRGLPRARPFGDKPGGRSFGDKPGGSRSGPPRGGKPGGAPRGDFKPRGPRKPRD